MVLILFCSLQTTLRLLRIYSFEYLLAQLLGFRDLCWRHFVSEYVSGFNGLSISPGSREIEGQYTYFPSIFLSRPANQLVELSMLPRISHGTEKKRTQSFYYRVPC